MTEEAGKVFSLGTDLTPIAPRTTADEFFQDEHVHIRNFSQGRTQESGFQTSDKDQLLIVVSGILCLKGAGKHGMIEIISERGINLGAGNAFYIPAGQSIDFSTSCGCVYTLIEVEPGAEIAEELKSLKPVTLASMVGKSGAEKDLLVNDQVRFGVESLDRHQQTDERAAAGKTLLYALSGKGAVTYDGSDYEIKGGRNFIMNAGDQFRIASKGRFSFAILTVEEASA